MQKTRKIEKSVALRMTILSGGLNRTGEYAENTKDRRVSGAQDDGFVGGLE
jgi:hypothetical protein